MIRYNLIRMIFLFLVGGYAYCIIEVLFRGYSHISMLLAGGLAFLMAGLMYERYKDDVPIIILMFAGMIIITTIELVFGIIVNMYMKLNVWDYSMYKINYKGQICLVFSGCWFFISYFLFRLFHIVYSWTITQNYEQRGILLQKIEI